MTPSSRPQSPGDVLLLPFRAAARLVTAFTGPWTRTNGVSWLKLIVFILVLRWAFFELYSIPSGSMEPVLHGDPRMFRGDRVAVNKALFGPRIPFTTIRLVPIGKPNRWDIVVFNNVEPNAEHPTLIKRIVGLPGEKVFIRGGQIEIDGVPVDPPEHLREILYYTRTVAPPEDMVRDYILSLAKQLGGTERIDKDAYGAEILRDDLEALHDVLADVEIATLSDADKNALIAKVRPVTIQMVGERLAAEFGIPSGFKYGLSRNPQYAQIPDGHYFLLGDNSGHSGDGRAFGWVPHKNLYGRAFAVVWPFDHVNDLTGFSSTWWGRLLLFGLPLAFVVHEVVRAFILLSWRVGRDNVNPELRPGDRVHVNRLSYGFRIPFTHGHAVGGRDPRPGEMAAFLQKDDDDRHVHLRFGRVDGVDENAVRVCVADNKAESIARGEVVGRAISVWWPLSRRRSLVDPARLQPAQRA